MQRLGSLRMKCLTRCVFRIAAPRPIRLSRGVATSESVQQPLKCCIVGSGPAGFYAAEAILKSFPNARISILEGLPVPFGLVRSGVAPDHPEVKVVSNKFEQIATNPRCGYFGNVRVGRDVSVDELRTLYDAVLLAYGADHDRELGVEGETLAGVHGARDFVGWLNAHPDPYYRAMKFDLSGGEAVIVGQGNVAIDVARMLLRSPDELHPTDISQQALDALRASRIRRVHVVGRRGPAQAAFTSKEMRELLGLAGCTTYIARDALTLNAASQEELGKDRPTKRLVELLSQKATIVDSVWELPEDEPGRKSLVLHFFLRPSRFVAGEDGRSVSAAEFERTRLEGPAGKQVAVATGETVTIPTGLVFRSTGYKSVALPGVPFDARSGTIPNVAGRVVDPTGRCVQPSTDARTQQPADARTPIVAGAVPGLYVCGWLKRGPSGIIGTNKWDAEETVVSMLEDVKCGALSARRSSSSDSAVITSNDAVSGSSAEAAVSAAATTGTARSDAAATAADASSDAGASAGGVAGSVGGELAELLRRRGVRTVTFDDWKRIEAEEEARGSRCGKVRCKIETIEEMLEIAQR